MRVLNSGMVRPRSPAAWSRFKSSRSSRVSTISFPIQQSPVRSAFKVTHCLYHFLGVGGAPISLLQDASRGCSENSPGGDRGYRGNQRIVPRPNERSGLAKPSGAAMRRDGGVDGSVPGKLLQPIHHNRRTVHSADAQSTVSYDQLRAAVAAPMHWSASSMAIAD